MIDSFRRLLPRSLLLIAVFWLAGLPVVSLLLGSMREGLQGGFTARYLRQVFLTADYVAPLLSTLELAAYVGLVATVLGSVLAWIMSRLRPPGSGLLEILIMAPIFISPFIGAIGWITLAQPNSGIINAVLHNWGLPEINVVSYSGVVFIMALFFVPYAYALLKNSIDRLNPELEEAAAICGANQIRTLLAVVLPLLWPSLLSAVIIIFVLSAEMFSIPGLLLVPQGFDFLAYTIYAKTTHWPINQAEASAVGVMLLIVTLAGMLVYSASVRIQERFITIGPRAARLDTSVSGVARFSGLTIVALFVLFSSILPVAAIAIRALLPFFSGELHPSEFTLDNIRNTLSDRLALTSLWNSLIVTVSATILLLIVAFLVALGQVRSRNAISTITWFIASIPVAVPGVLIGVGLIWLYVGTPVYATLFIILLVMMARFLPVQIRLFETGLIQLGRELEEAAAVCGASESVTTRAIRLPLLAGTIRSAITITGTQVFNELTASALLFTSTSSVLPVVIFNYMFDGDYSRASALALVQVVVIMALLAAIGLGSFLFGRGRTLIGRTARKIDTAARQPDKTPAPHVLGRSEAVNS